MNISSFELSVGSLFAVITWFLITTILASVISSVINYFWVSKVAKETLFKQKQIGKTLNEFGLDEVRCDNGRYTKREKNIIFGLQKEPAPYEIDFFFLTGYRFFSEELLNEKYNQRIKNLMDNGCAIRILLAQPDNSVDNSENYHEEKAAYMYELAQFEDENNTKYHNASFIDRASTLSRLDKLMTKDGAFLDENTATNALIKEMQNRNGDQNEQILFIEKKVAEIQKELSAEDGSIELRYYRDEYRLPSIRLKREKNGLEEEFLWTNIATATQEAVNSVQMRFYASGTDKYPIIEENKRNFDFIWNHAVKPE